MIRFLSSIALAALCLAQPVSADEVEDTLNSAIDAYRDGDMQYALEELAYATSLLTAMKSDSLSAFLPQAPEGWTREVNAEMNAGMAMMGGGVGAEATYSNGQDSFKVTMMADNAMVAGLGSVLANATIIPGIKLHRAGRQKFAEQDGELTGLIDNRVLIQANGASTDVMLDLLRTIDFRELGRFGG